MIDLRSAEDVENLVPRVSNWHGAEFVWTRWSDVPHDESWTHDHCVFCAACICNHRDRFPEITVGPEDGGHYRHAYFTERSNQIYLWVCRSCFKRMQPRLEWIVRSSNSITSD